MLRINEGRIQNKVFNNVRVMKGKCCRGIPNQVGDNKEEKYHSEGRKNVGRNLGGEAVG
jgi:hypothetical protein